MEGDRYEATEHTADLGLKAYGSSLKEAFENAAFGMFDMMVDLDRVSADRQIEVTVSADDTEALLVAFLNELLFVFEVQRLALAEFEIVEWDENTKLKATARGAPIGADQEMGAPIKACTYHDVRVEEGPEGFEVQVLFDV